MHEQLKPSVLAKRQIRVAVLTVIGGIIISFLLAFPIKWLWNWLMPELFELPIISAIQAWGISFLTSMIFKPNVTINEPKKLEKS
ncbi:MAG TPA: hypothetical protein HA367_06140 [Candidatus Methanofastidiosum sp.]|jgi:hypothetical protein|nr:hypothetical protein [Methanofastidiosum sp.]